MQLLHYADVADQVDRVQVLLASLDRSGLDGSAVSALAKKVFDSEDAMLMVRNAGLGVVL